MKKNLRLALRVIGAVACGWLAMRATSGHGRVGVRDADALCVVELAPGELKATTDFTVAQPLDSFFLMVAPRHPKGLCKITLSSDAELICSVPTNGAFSAGRDIKPGRYHLQLEQDPGGGGGKGYVSDHPLGMTGWQLYSRGFAGLVALSAVWALATRKSGSLRHRMLSRLIFNYLLLALLALFAYLLLHEGGHAWAAFLFGKFSLARSDFWGWNGQPHSGLKGIAEILPWQQAVISFGGPALPTLIGWLLFALHRTSRAKRFFATRPTMNFFAGGIVLMCVFPAVVLAAQLLGVAQDGDWRGFIHNVPGPLWLVKTVLWLAWALNLVVITLAAATFRRAWRTHMAAVGKTSGGGTVAAGE